MGGVGWVGYRQRQDFSFVTIKFPLSFSVLLFCSARPSKRGIHHKIVATRLPIGFEEKNCFFSGLLSACLPLWLFFIYFFFSLHGKEWDAQV